MPRNLQRLVLGLLLAGLLSGCVTQVESRFARKASAERALEAYTQLGLAYLQQGNPGLARRPLTRALEIDPKAPQAHNAMALLLQREGEYVLAEQHFQSALRYDPDFTQARNNYAALLYELARYDEACRQLEHGVRDTAYAGRAQLFENLGLCYRKLARDAEATAAFERALRLQPSAPRALLELAALRFAQGDVTEAQDYLRQYDKVASPTPRSLWLGIRIARSLNDTATAARYAEQLARDFPASVDHQQHEEPRAP